MDSEKIFKYIKQLEDNIAFFKKENELLENTIESIKKPSAIINDVELKDLLKESYSKDEIVTAYNKMMKYEGISLDRSGGLITDTFIEFLAGLRDE